MIVFLRILDAPLPSVSDDPVLELGKGSCDHSTALSGALARGCSLLVCMFLSAAYISSVHGGCCPAGQYEVLRYDCSLLFLTLKLSEKTCFGAYSSVTTL